MYGALSLSKSFLALPLEISEKKYSFSTLFSLQVFIFFSGDGLCFFVFLLFFIVIIFLIFLSLLCSMRCFSVFNMFVCVVFLFYVLVCFSLFSMCCLCVCVVDLRCYEDFKK